jgi:hypothetical protein
MASERSAWKVVGIGCAVLAVLGVLIAVVGGIGFIRWGKSIEADHKDPVARTEKAKKILGTDAFPDDYHAMVALTVPFDVLQIAILTDREPGSDGMIQSFGDRGLIYLRLIRVGQQGEELRDYFEGRTSDARVLRDNNINIRVDEIITRGTIGHGDGTLMYVAQRGSITAQSHSGEGITALCMIDCPGDKRMRMAIWFTPDPDPDAEIEDLDLTGTPADEAVLAEFMDRFRFCD